MSLGLALGQSKGTAAERNTDLAIGVLELFSLWQWFVLGSWQVQSR
jgi:hypothetical protein